MAVVCIILGLLLILRMLWSSWNVFHEGEAQLSQGQISEACLSYARSIRWSIAGTFTEAARGRLDQLSSQTPLCRSVKEGSLNAVAFPDFLTTLRVFCVGGAFWVWALSCGAYFTTRRVRFLFVAIPSLGGWILGLIWA